MYTRLNRERRTPAVVAGVVTLSSVVVLLTWDLIPQFFPARAHDFLAALPLTLIAIAYLLYQVMHRPSAMELLKATMLAVAFLAWAANQYWPDMRQATLFNDIAIALFVIDVFLVMVGWPSTSPDESFAETYTEER